MISFHQPYHTKPTCTLTPSEYLKSAGGLVLLIRLPHTLPVKPLGWSVTMSFTSIGLLMHCSALSCCPCSTMTTLQYVCRFCISILPRNLSLTVVTCCLHPIHGKFFKIHDLLFRAITAFKVSYHTVLEICISEQFFFCFWLHTVLKTLQKHCVWHFKKKIKDSRQFEC